MFNFESNICDTRNGDIDTDIDMSSDDEYFSSEGSDDEEWKGFEYLSDASHEEIFDFDCDDSGSDDDFDSNLNEDYADFNITFDDTITKALILWAVKFFVSHSALTALLEILRKFGHTKLPKLAQTLLRTPRVAVKPRICLPGEFFYRGIQYNLYRYNQAFFSETDVITMDFFIDGLSLSQSSKVKMWPIMGSFVDQPNIRPIVVACYGGKGDPADIDDYMKEFVAELKKLLRDGLEVTKNKVNKKFVFRCFIADAPARSFATGTVGHMSYVGCPKCDQVSCSQGHKLYYQFFVGELRTDESFRQRVDEMHHKPQYRNRSSLLEGVIGMVSQFVIDAMHAIDLGVTKKIVKVIFGNKSCSKVTKDIFAALETRFLSFRSFVPSEFVRRPRTIVELSQFKAAECRQMLLYTLPVLLKNLVNPQLYQQVLKLHVAIRLLSDPKGYKENINAARKLINDFVDKYDETLGAINFTFNTHCLLHIPDYVEKYGPLYSFSAYKYENHMRLIKRLLRRPSGYVKQFFNRVEEMRFAEELEDGIQIESKADEFILEANSLRDGCCMVEPGYPLLITNSFTRNGLKVIRGFRFLECRNFYDDPVPSMENMGIILAGKLSTVEEEFPETSIVHKFFRLPFEDDFVLIPLLHFG